MKELNMSDMRKPAVASLFYPDDAINLKRIINNYLNDVPDEVNEYFRINGIDNIFGIVVPHAGYFYSGAVASYCYSLLRQKTFDTVILIGPSHFTNFEGFSLPIYKSFQTPLGEIQVDTQFINLLASKGAGVFDFVNSAHLKEHSLEVQLPFLQTVLEEGFKIVPILMGEQTLKNAEDAAEILFKILDEYDKHFIIVISTDLSHYHEDSEARKMDQEFMTLFQNMNTKRLMQEIKSSAIEACGAGPVAVLLETGRKMLRNNIKTLNYKTSGEVSGDLSRVVGYLSAVIW
jgi:AmmeMemoRadiSam system protein B